MALIELSRPYGAHPAQRYDVVVPDDRGRRSLVVCFHGGWWHQGHHYDLRALMLLLAEHGHPAATLGVRPLGDGGARQGTDLVADARHGLEKIVEDAQLAGYDGGVVLLGSGSGSLTALVAAHQSAQEKSPVRVRAVVACGLTPSLDHNDGWAPALGKFIDQFAGGNRHALSPLHLNPDGFPPILSLHGDQDVDVPAKLAQRFHQRQVAAGEDSRLMVLAGAGHHFLEHPYAPAGRTALDHLWPFLAEAGIEPERG
jgi:pimeloyl-ACP methyl ester carboxylesterase